MKVGDIISDYCVKNIKWMPFLLISDALFCFFLCIFAVTFR